MRPAEAAASARDFIIGIRQRSRQAGAARLLADLRGLGIEAELKPFSATETINDYLRANRAAKGIERSWGGASGETQTVAKSAQESTLRRTAITEASEAFNRRANAVDVPKEDAALLELVWDSQLEACPRCRERDGETTPYGTPFPGAQPGGMHPRCLCSWHVQRRSGPAPQAAPAPTREPPQLRLVPQPPATPPVAVAPPKPSAAAKPRARVSPVPKGIGKQASKDFRLLLRGAPESALDFSREGYRPALSIYGTGLSRRQINDIATGRVAPPGSSGKLPPIHVAIRTQGDLASGKRLQLIDGRHRLEAAQAAGATHMRANVTVYGPRGGIKWRGERVIRTPVRDPLNRHER